MTDYKILGPSIEAPEVEDPAGVADSPAEKLLLQQHQSLLARMVVSQTTCRTINTLMASLMIVHMMQGGRSLLASLAVVCITILVTLVWRSERRTLVKKLSIIELALAKKNKNQFESIFINYTFEVTGHVASEWVTRFEPEFWFGIITSYAASILLTVLRGS
jgi:hypothetical protein